MKMNDTKLAANAAKMQPKRGLGKPFKKGQSGNPIGKKKGTLNEVTKFKEAIAAYEKEQNKDIYKIILEKANRYPQVLIAIFKALVPQQTESNISITFYTDIYEKMTDEEIIEEFKRDLDIFTKNRQGRAGTGINKIRKE